MRCEHHANYNREYYQRTRAKKRKRQNHCSKCGKAGHQIVTCDLVNKSKES